MDFLRSIADYFVNGAQDLTWVSGWYAIAAFSLALLAGGTVVFAYKQAQATRRTSGWTIAKT